MTENISQLHVKDTLPIGKVGQVYGDSKNFVEDNAPHPAGAAKQKSQFEITAKDDTKYSYSFEGETISFTSGSGATKNSVADGLKSAHESNIVTRGQAVPSIDNSDNLVLTGEDPGQSFDVSTDDANLTLSELQAASDQNDVPSGVAVWWDGDGGVELSPSFDLQTYTLTVNSVENDTDYWVVFEVDGETHRAKITSTGTATEDDILNALQTALSNLGLDTISSSVDTGPTPSELTLKAATIGGSDLQVTSLSPDLDSTLSTEGTEFKAAFAGMSRHTYDTESDEPYSTDTGPFGQSEQVTFLRRGLMIVDASNAAKGDRAFIGTESDEDGEVFDSQKANGSRIEAPKSALMFIDENILEIKVGY